LTYSSGGIIKKLDLKTLKVVDLEESTTPAIAAAETQTKIQNQSGNVKKETEEIAAIGDNSTAMPAGNTTPVANDYGAIGDNSTAAPVNSGEGKGMLQNQIRNSNESIVVEDKAKSEIVVPKVQQNKAPAVNASPSISSNKSTVQSLGVQSRDAMLAKYKTAIQLGAFSAPKWELMEPLSKYGKIVTYKNENGTNVVWIVGFANRAAAENILPQVKATPGFENAYVTGK